MPIIRRAFDLLRLGRPHFLAGGLILYCLGVAVAGYQGVPINVTLLIWGQIAVTAIQWATHYSNDYFDLAADRINPTPTWWSGGSRVLVEGLVSPRVALAVAMLFSALALVATLVLTQRLKAPPWTPGILLLALFLGWSYSAPPLRLHSRGVGELASSLLVAGLTPLTGYYLQAGRLAALPLLAAVPLVCLQVATMLAVEYPDFAADAAAGKRTLMVRMGVERAAQLNCAVLAVAFVLLLPAVALGLPAVVAGAALLSGAPLAAWQVWSLKQGAWRRPACWQGVTTRGIMLIALPAAAELAAFVWLMMAA
ncbi:MAG: prenyltransferase [Anaerolineae bacterium]